MKISLIAAMGPGRVIGKENKLPWHYSADLQYFKKITSGKTVVMGRNTYLSIGKPLPNRRNIILSEVPMEGLEYYDTIEKFLEQIESEHGDDEIFIIGGSSIYKQFLERGLIDTVYLTHVKKEHDGDSYFPQFEDDFVEVSREETEDLDFVVYRRKLKDGKMEDGKM